MEWIILQDFEFTRLPTEYDPTAEFVETKMGLLNLETFELTNVRNWVHKTDTASGPGAFYKHRITPAEQIDEPFSADFYERMLAQVDPGGLATDPTHGRQLAGWSVKTDAMILGQQYQVYAKIRDAQWLLTHTQAYEALMAENGRSLEICHYLITGSLDPIPHKGPDELYVIARIIKEALTTERDDYLSLVPYGPWRGMPLSEYVRVNRRQADGYRRNNDDAYADALDAAITALDN